MKLSVNRYHVKLIYDGKSMLDNYYGYTSRKKAQERADEWEELGFHAVVIDHDEKLSKEEVLI